MSELNKALQIYLIYFGKQIYIFYFIEFTRKLNGVLGFWGAIRN